MCTMDYPEFIVSNQKEESISKQRVNIYATFMSSFKPVQFRSHDNIQYSDIENIVDPDLMAS